MIVVRRLSAGAAEASERLAPVPQLIKLTADYALSINGLQLYGRLNDLAGFFTDVTFI